METRAFFTTICINFRSYPESSAGESGDADAVDVAFAAGLRLSFIFVPSGCSDDRAGRKIDRRHPCTCDIASSEMIPDCTEASSVLAMMSRTSYERGS